jgi:hypothetical protein
MRPLPLGFLTSSFSFFSPYLRLKRQGAWRLHAPLVADAHMPSEEPSRMHTAPKPFCILYTAFYITQ